MLVYSDHTLFQYSPAGLLLEGLIASASLPAAPQG